MIDHVSDDELHAYLDGACTEAQRARVEAALSSDVEVQARLAKLRKMGNLLKSAYPQPLDPEDRFARIVEEGFRDRERARFRRPARGDFRQSAVAAIALSTVMAGGGFWLGTSASPDGGKTSIIAVEPGSDLFAALEKTPSGQVARISETQAVKPILSFQAANGAFCREVELDMADAASIGVACRQTNAWRWITIVASASAPAAADGYATVGEGGAAIIERTFRDLQSGDPLSPSDERKLITSGWARP